MNETYYIFENEIDISYDLCNIIKYDELEELNKSNALVVYAFSDITNEKWSLIRDTCKQKEINHIFLYLQNDSFYIGPYNSKISIQDCIKHIESKEMVHKLIFPSCLKNDFGSTISEKYILEFVFDYINSLDMIHLNKTMIQILFKPFNIIKHALCIEALTEDNFIFNEHDIFSNKNIKSSKDVYHINADLNYETIKKLIVNPYFGICNHEYITLNSKFIPMVCAETIVPQYGINNSFGRTFSYKNAKLCALLENLERHFNSSNYQNRGKIYGSYNEYRNGNIVHPNKLCLHEDILYEHPSMMFEKFDEDKKYYWVWMWSIKYKDYFLVPEQFIYYIDNDEISISNRFVYESSNGAALGTNLEEAVLHSCFEIIERDNFLVYFFNKLEPTEIDVDNSKYLEDVVQIKILLNKFGYKLHFYDISLELGIPTIWCLMINENDDALVKTYSAAGTNFNPEAALISAMVEVVASVPIYEEIYKSKEVSERMKEIYDDFDKLTEFEDHVLLFSHPKATEFLQYALRTSAKLKLDQIYTEWYETEAFKNIDLNDDIQLLFERILTHYDDILIADLSGDQLNEIPLKCTKVIIPGMQPMYFGHQYRRIDKKRICEGPVLSGKRSKPIDEKSINKTPHPFP